MAEPSSQSPQRFIILSLPRTGSTYLVDYLDAISGMRCLSEVYNSDVVLFRHHQPVDPTLADKAARDADPMGFLQRLEQDVGDCRWFGLKLFPSHNLKLLNYFCTSRKWKKIFLWRDNLVEQYISFLLASTQYGHESWERVADDARITVPLGSLVDDLHAIETSYIEIEDALSLADTNDVFTLEYADMARADLMEQLLRFLGVDEADIKNRLAQTAAVQGDALSFERGPRASTRIANDGEVRAVLKGTRFGRWLAA